MAENEEEDFTWQYLDDEVNVPDVISSARDNKLYGIVSQNDGGIIAYAVGKVHATQIVKALRIQKAIDEMAQAMEAASGSNT